MTTLESLAQLRYRSASLPARVEAAMATAAFNIYHEDTSTPNHSDRVKWAQKALVNPSVLSQQRERLMWLVVLNPTIAADGEGCSDSDLQFVVNSYIDIVLIKD